jgi:hypothetical protein
MQKETSPHLGLVSYIDTDYASENKSARRYGNDDDELNF